MFQYLFLCIYR